jgi:hypothetical protein
MYSCVLSSSADWLLCPRLGLGGVVGFLVSWCLLVGSLVSSVDVQSSNMIQ